MVFLLSEPLAAATAAVAITVIPGAPQFLPPVVNAWVPIPGPVVAARPSAVPVRTIVDDLPKQLPQQPKQATAVDVAAKKASAPAEPAAVAQTEGIVSATRPKTRTTPFQVRAAAGGQYFIKLVNVADEGDVIFLYARGGNTLDVAMPVGTYRMRFATGPTWHGDKVLFGPQTTYWSAEQTVAFRNPRSGPAAVAIEISGQRGGRMRVSSIDRNRF